jgi:hypothetical protein
MGSVGAVELALIPLLGWYFSEQSSVRSFCRWALILWITLLTIVALANNPRADLIAPGLVVVTWLVTSAVKNTVARDD